MVLNPALNNVGFLELILYRAQHPHSQDHAHLERFHQSDRRRSISKTVLFYDYDKCLSNQNANRFCCCSARRTVEPTGVYWSGLPHFDNVVAQTFINICYLQTP